MAAAGSAAFAPPGDRQALEEGSVFSPRFDQRGLLTCVTVDHRSGAVLMVAHMNAEALSRTIATGLAHYWSRSRNCLWLKGESSGQVQSVQEILVDCDQDALVLRVEVGGDGGACHTGHRSCFYRRVLRDPDAPPASVLETLGE